MKKTITQITCIAIAMIMLFAQSSKAQTVHLYLDSVLNGSHIQFCKSSVDTVIVYKPAGETVQSWNCNIPPYDFYTDSVIIPNNFNTYASSGILSCSFVVDAKTIFIHFVDSVHVPGLLNQTICGTTPLTLDAGNGNQGPNCVNYFWSTGDSTQTITTDTTSLYTVHISNACNSVYDTASLIFVSVHAKICAASFDPTPQKNKVVWYTPNLKADKAIILKRNLANSLVAIDTVPFSAGEWIDTASHPQQEQNGYALMVLDTCGNLSDTSAEHVTVWLQISTYTGNVYFQYTPYQGAPVNTYTLFGIDGLGNVDSITSRPASFTNMLLADSVAAHYQKFFIGFPITCGATRSTNIMIKSNVVSGTTGIKEYSLSDFIHVYPTLTTGTVNITTDLTIKDIKVYTTLGQLVLTTRNKSFDIPNRGLYLVSISTDKGSITQKVVVQ